MTHQMVVHNTTRQKLFSPFISTDEVKSQPPWRGVLGFNSLQLEHTFVSKVEESIPKLLSMPILWKNLTLIAAEFLIQTSVFVFSGLISCRGWREKLIISHLQSARSDFLEDDVGGDYVLTLFADQAIDTSL